jgi:predicted dehydrogenase
MASQIQEHSLMGRDNERSTRELRIGFVGAGFIADFHLKAFAQVRNAVIAGVFSPRRDTRETFASKADAAELGPCRAYATLEEIVSSEDLDALWILSPNDTRLDVMRALANARTSARSSIRYVACEKPLARSLAEAKEMVALAEKANVLTGYLENQIFSTAVERGKEIIWRRAVPSGGRPYLARAAEEHAGPHKPWFWTPERQGGGVLSDMMCHSVEVGRFLLTDPAAARRSLKLVSVQATTANLKWTPERVKRELLRAGFSKEESSIGHVAEDFARGVLTFEDELGARLIVEATTSWAYVGPGLRIDLSVMGPEYSMEFSSLQTGLRVFLGRNISGAEGEDLVEKQNAEQGLMPVIDDEPSLYGYVAENRHFVDSFRKCREPVETFADGLEVVRMIMALYKSAESGATVDLPDDELDEYVPAVMRASQL